MDTKNKRKYDPKLIGIIAGFCLIAVGIVLVWWIWFLGQGDTPFLNTGTTVSHTSTTVSEETVSTTESTEATEQTLPPELRMIDAFAREHGLALSDWPESMVTLLEKNPEAEEFVLNYPLKKDLTPEINLSEYANSQEVPLFLQWDERWGYTKYGSGVMGITGCGPTCLSMACMYILDDPQLTPRYVADFAVENGYCVPGSGSTWTLISEGGRTLGLDVIEIPLDENRIVRNLEVDNPIICIMGPGDFTTDGHFVVMTGYEDGKIRINDPNSPMRSEMLWDYDAIKDQIRNLWVCR